MALPPVDNKWNIYEETQYYNVSFRPYFCVFEGVFNFRSVFELLWIFFLASSEKSITCENLIYFRLTGILLTIFPFVLLDKVGNVTSGSWIIFRSYFWKMGQGWGNQFVGSIKCTRIAKVIRQEGRYNYFSAESDSAFWRGQSHQLKYYIFI